jgi:hypothetical protein
MSGSDQPSRAGRLTALAILAASAVLFLTALLGIATIDPNADAAAPPSTPAVHNISLDHKRNSAPERRDCPWRKQQQSLAPDGVAS